MAVNGIKQTFGQYGFEQNFGSNLVVPATYIIYYNPDNQLYYAEPSRERDDLQMITGTNAALVIQSAINALPSGGGKIFIKNGTYNLGANGLTIASTFNGELIIEGEAMKNYYNGGTSIESTVNGSILDKLGTTAGGRLWLKNLRFKHTTPASGLTTLDLMYINAFLENVMVWDAGTRAGTGIKAGPTAMESTVVWNHVHSEGFAICFDLSVDHLIGIGMSAAYPSNRGFYIHDCWEVQLIEPHVFQPTQSSVFAFYFDYVYGNSVLISPWLEKASGADCTMFKHLNVRGNVQIIGYMKPAQDPLYDPTFNKGLYFVGDNDEGTATITAGNTSVTVSHRCSIANATYAIILTPTSDTGGKRYWISEKTSSTFTISIDSAYTSNITFDWVMQRIPS